MGWRADFPDSIDEINYPDRVFKESLKDIPDIYQMEPSELNYHVLTGSSGDTYKSSGQDDEYSCWSEEQKGKALHALVQRAKVLGCIMIVSYSVNPLIEYMGNANWAITANCTATGIIPKEQHKGDDYG